MTVIAYEQRLQEDLRWGFMQGSMHFERNSEVQKTLERVTRRLGELKIPYAVIGDLALFFHGYRKFTEVVEMLVTQEGLQAIHRQLECLGCVLLAEGSRHLRDAVSGVRIDLRVSGEYPGDGQLKPIAYPDPDGATVTLEGMRFLTRSGLVELYLATSMSKWVRLWDLANVQEMIKHLHLAEDFALQLHPSVRDKYHELWWMIQTAPPGPDSDYWEKS